MTQPATDPAHNASPFKLSGEQALTRLLALIRDGINAEKMTPTVLSEAFGLEVIFDGATDYGVGTQVSRDWYVNVDLKRRHMQNPALRFTFDPIDRNADSPMTDICQIDFDQFSDSLQKMGFASDIYYGEHQRVIHYNFVGPQHRLEVYVRGEANSPHEKIGHKCVEWVHFIY